jgi:hypothetical protein
MNDITTPAALREQAAALRLHGLIDQALHMGVILDLRVAVPTAPVARQLPISEERDRSFRHRDRRFRERDR